MEGVNDSEDGVLDVAEYADGLHAYGWEEKAAHRAFKLWAKDKSGKEQRVVDLKRWLELGKECFYSKSKDAPGNHIFGLCPFATH